MAPPPPSPAHRRAPLTDVRSIALAALTVTASALAACASDDASPSVVEASTTIAPATPAGDSDAADSDQGGVATTVDQTESSKVDPARTAGAVDAPAGVQPDGFTTATVRITSADGDVCDVCLWLADAGDERGRGLMGVTDLGEPVGMLFRFDPPTSGNFFMFNTPMPLSIAWFGADGSYLSETDMEPCLVDDSAECERYGPGAEYVDAIEMVQGELDVIGVGPGSSIELLAEHDICPVVE